MSTAKETAKEVFAPEARPAQKSIVLTPEVQAFLSDYIDKNLPGHYARPLIKLFQQFPTLDYVEPTKA